MAERAQKHAGERVLVTGANRGLGLEFVRQYAEAGARVFAGCRNPDGAGFLSTLVARYPGQVEVLPLDVTRRESIDAAVSHIALDGDGTLDVLINNAGTSPRGEAFSNLDATSMAAVLEVNAIAPLIVAQRCHRLLSHSHRPRIVNISSSMGSLAEKEAGRHYSYSASKAALNMLTRAAAHDLAASGVIVVALHPGWVRTDLGGPDAELTAAESVGDMLGVIDGLDASQSSRFLNRDGREHPW
jgi:NAD(P)-dependent dehydrogenase (short-subunit alcohol dehydrogenase family)